jgi:class 3 adenylate cyclase
MPELPSGAVTFLFTDIEDSTARWEQDRHPMAGAGEHHVALLEAAVQTHGGTHFKTVGNAVQAAFPAAPQAVTAAVAGQRVLLAARSSFNHLSAESRQRARRPAQMRGETHGDE